MSIIKVILNIIVQFIAGIIAIIGVCAGGISDLCCLLLEYFAGAVYKMDDKFKKKRKKTNVDVPL